MLKIQLYCKTNTRLGCDHEIDHIEIKFDLRGSMSAGSRSEEEGTSKVETE